VARETGVAMIEKISEMYRVECDNESCFESVQVACGVVEDLYDHLTFTSDWEVCFDPLNDDNVSVYCPDHKEGVYDEVDTD
jgi:hypothetical protein